MTPREMACTYLDEGLGTPGAFAGAAVEELRADMTSNSVLLRNERDAMLGIERIMAGYMLYMIKVGF